MAKRAVSPELARLRALAIQRHKAATKKISRNTVARGAKISGTEFDPRRSLALVRNYNSKQLAVYIKKVDEFTSRKTQFVPDAKYRPMPIGDWQKYKAAEKTLNDINQKRFKKIKDLKLPNGFTVAQKLSQTDSLHPQMHNPASNSAHREINRRSKTAKSLQALAKLEMDMKNRATPEYRAHLEAQNRLSVSKMLDVIGDGKMKLEISALSSEKFNFLWDYSGEFANNLSMSYEALKKMLEAELSDNESLGKATRAYPRRDLPQLKDRGHSDAQKFLAWLQEQPEEKFIR